MEESPTIYEQIRTSGYSRRDFLKFCAWVTAFMGIEASGIGNVVRAMETKHRLPVVWFHFQECTCCSESFLRSSRSEERRVGKECRSRWSP